MRVRIPPWAHPAPRTPHPIAPRKKETHKHRNPSGLIPTLIHPINKSMRIWDIHPKHLCRRHLLGEHRELHAIWNILTKHNRKGGYARHPETLRWVGKLSALYSRHEALVAEMTRRGYKHHSPLDKKLARGKKIQRTLLHTIAEQKEILRQKPCECFKDHKKETNPGRKRKQLARKNAHRSK